MKISIDIFFFNGQQLTSKYYRIK